MARGSLNGSSTDGPWSSADGPVFPKLGHLRMARGRLRMAVVPKQVIYAWACGRSVKFEL